MKTYVVQFAEQEGVRHVHFHVIPRRGDLPGDRRGGGAFGYLDPSPDHRVDDGREDELAQALRTHGEPATGALIPRRRR